MKPNATPQTAAASLKKLSRLRPTLAIVLGSGFHHVLTGLRVEKKISFAKIPGFPVPSVSGHAGELYFGRLGGTPVLVLSGRAHFYEGHPMERVTFAVRALAAFGIQRFAVDERGGRHQPEIPRGRFHGVDRPHQFDGSQPVARPGGPRSAAICGYDSGLRREIARAVVSRRKSCNLRLQRGVYLAVSGPSYETPAEIRAFARLGADAVGMSTVPEAMVARQCGLNVAAISCITNLAAGISKEKLSHAEVLETADRVKTLAAKLLKYFCGLYGQK